MWIKQAHSEIKWQVNENIRNNVKAKYCHSPIKKEKKLTLSHKGQ